MDNVEDTFQKDWQQLLDTHPVMSMSRNDKGKNFLY